MLEIFGIGPKVKKPQTLDEIQQYIMKEEANNE